MFAIDGIEAGYAFLPGDGWSSDHSSRFPGLVREYGFVIKPEPLYLVTKDALKYSRGGMIVAAGYRSPPFISAWRLYEDAFVSSSAPQLTTILVASELNRPLSLITNAGEIDSAFTSAIPDWIRELGVSVQDELTSEWFVTPDKQQKIITRRRLLISSEGILNHLTLHRQHLPVFPPSLVAELSLGSPLAAVSRCTLPEQTPAIERLDNETTALLWSNVRVTLVNQVISHKQLTHKTVLWRAETPKHLPSA